MSQATLLRRGIAALLVTVLVMSAGASTALASSNTTDTASDDHANDASDITINGLDVGLEDVHITGESLPEVNIDDRMYTIDERSVTIDGLTMTVNDAEIGINDITITIEDSTLEIHDVSIGEA